MINIIFNILLLFLIITAFFMVFTKDILNSIITLPVFAAILVVIFVILQAPGPAVAEAVISAGLTTAFFVITLNRTEY